MNSRGYIRLRYVQEYMVMVRKQKKNLEEVRTRGNHSHTKSDKKPQHERNSEAMNIALDPVRVTALRELAEYHLTKPKWTLCPITGSKEDPMRIWYWSTHVVVTSNDEDSDHKAGWTPMRLILTLQLSNVVPASAPASPQRQ